MWVGTRLVRENLWGDQIGWQTRTQASEAVTRSVSHQAARQSLVWGCLMIAQTGMQRLAGGCSLSPLALLVLTILSTDLCLCQPKSVGAFHFFFIALCPQPESPKENSLWCTTVELTLFFHCILDSNAPPFPSCLPCMHLLFHIWPTDPAGWHAFTWRRWGLQAKSPRKPGLPLGYPDRMRIALLHHFWAMSLHCAAPPRHVISLCFVLIINRWLCTVQSKDSFCTWNGSCSIYIKHIH